MMIMTPDIARTALVLLSRVDIKGAEAPAFMQVMAVLQQIAEAKDADMPTPMRVVPGGAAE